MFWEQRPTNQTLNPNQDTLPPSPTHTDVDHLADHLQVMFQKTTV